MVFNELFKSWLWSFRVKKYIQKHVDLLLWEEKDKTHYVLIKDFSTFTCDHPFHLERMNCSQNVSTEEKLKRHFNDWFKINGKQKVKK